MVFEWLGKGKDGAVALNSKVARKDDEILSEQATNRANASMGDVYRLQALNVAKGVASFTGSQRALIEKYGLTPSSGTATHELIIENKKYNFGIGTDNWGTLELVIPKEN